jgi:hypothetical protein
MMPEKASTQSSSPKGQASVRRYQTALKRLDREIQQNEERLTSRQARLRAEKSAPVIIGRGSGRSRNQDSQAELQAEIEALQLRLKRLHEERFEVYESGRKAGFLPGELDDKYINP